MLPPARSLPRQGPHRDVPEDGAAHVDAVVGGDELGSTDRRRLAEAYALTGLAWWEWDVRTGRLGWSEGMRRLAGLEHLDHEPTIQDWVPLLEPADVAATTVMEHAALTVGTPYRHVFRIRTPAGERRYLESWTGPLRDADGDIVGLRGATLDVSDRESAQRAHHASESHFQVVFDHAPHGMAMIWLQGDRAGQLIRANDAFARLLGWERAEEMVGRPLSGWTPPEEQPRSRARFEAMAAGRSRGSAYSRQYLRRDGSIVHAWVTTSVVHDETGVPEFAIAHCIDDTGRRQHLRELERLARTDALTGLANRTVVDAELASSRPGRPGSVSGLLLMDLDRFKLINDSQGHPVGDALLVQVARRLRDAVPAHHTVARLGGDEFVVVLHVGDDGVPVDPTTIAETVVEVLREPFDLPGGERIVLTTSVGVALVDDDGSTHDLLKHADLALYEAKDVGRNRAARFDARLRRRTEARVRSETLLRTALREDLLRVELQPLVSLADGTARAAEALVRLDGPDGLPVHTGDLVKVAEETGLVVGLDLWVVREVTRLLALDARRVAAGLAPVMPGVVGVNVSGRSIGTGDFVPRVRAVMDGYGVPPSRFAVELTETSLLHDSGQVEQAVDELVAMGVRVGIDDFGTGYSALAYLPRFPLAFVKIDMSFVQRLGTSRRSDAVVAAIVDLGHAHDMTVIGEGVETAEQADALRSMGCEMGQGWLFGHPAPVDLP